MKLRLWSDLHTEFQPFVPVYTDEDKDIVLIIAGDLCPYRYNKGIEFFKDLADHYRKVLYVPGNHEYYGSGINVVDIHFKNIESIIPNYHYLNPDEIMVDDVKFVGGSLWTDFNNANSLDMFYARQGMNDFKLIRNDMHNYRKLTPEDMVSINIYHRQFFKDKLKDYKGKSVIITHHAPIATHFTKWGSELDWAFHNTGLESFIEEAKPIYWFHGHTHDQYSFEIFDTKIVCNPRGYPQEHTFRTFNPDLIVEI